MVLWYLYNFITFYNYSWWGLVISQLITVGLHHKQFRYDRPQNMTYHHEGYEAVTIRVHDPLNTQLDRWTRLNQWRHEKSHQVSPTNWGISHEHLGKPWWMDLTSIWIKHVYYPAGDLLKNSTMTGWWFGTMEFYHFPYLGMSYSQLTNSYFSEG